MSILYYNILYTYNLFENLNNAKYKCIDTDNVLAYKFDIS